MSGSGSPASSGTGGRLAVPASVAAADASRRLSTDVTAKRLVSPTPITASGGSPPVAAAAGDRATTPTPSPAPAPAKTAQQLAAETKREVLASLDDYEAQLRAELKTDRYPFLHQLPAGDIHVVQEKRPPRIVTEKLVPTEAKVDGLERAVAEAMNLMEKDWLIVQKDSELYDGTVGRTYKFDPDVLPPSEQLSADTAKVPAGEEVCPELTRSVHTDVRKQYKELRRNDRINVFRFYTVKSRKEQEAPSDPRRKVPPFVPHEHQAFLVEAKELSFSLEHAREPVFCTLTLFNIGTEERVAESFYFDLNDNEVLNRLLPSRIKDRQPESAARHCLFTLTSPSPDIYAVLQLEHVLRGEEVDEALEPYFKFHQLKPKDRTKLLDEIEFACDRLAPYSQTIAYATAPLFNETNNELLTSTVVFSNWVRSRTDMSDAELCQTLVKERELERKKGKKEVLSAKKLLPFQSTLTVRKLLDMDEERQMWNRLDPQLQQLKPFDMKDAKKPFIKCLQPFTPPDEFPFPMLQYENIIHVALQTVNLSKQKEEARNIAVRVKLLDGDMDPAAPGIPNLYGKGSGRNFVAEWVSTVQYHEKKPVWMDEFKVKLPSKLQQHHHLLFTFYHITCQTKGAKKEKEKNPKPVENLLGYAVLALYGPDYENGRDLARVVSDGLHNMPVATHLPPQYRSTNESQIKWIDNGRPYFTIQTRLQSSLYVQNDILNALFKKAYQEIDDISLPAAVTQVERLPPALVTKQFALILNVLVHIMCTKSDAASRAAFDTMVSVIEKVNSLNPYASKLSSRDPLLVSYVDYVLDPPPKSNKQLHEEIVKHMLQNYREAMQDLQEEERRKREQADAEAAGGTRRKHEAAAAAAAAAAGDDAGGAGGAGGRPSSRRMDLVFKFSWVLFDMVYKSIVLRLIRDGTLDAVENRRGRYSPGFMNSLRDLLVALFMELSTPRVSNITMGQALTSHLALFLKDLMSVMDRSFAIEMVYRCLDALGSNPDVIFQVAFKFGFFLRVIADHEHFVPLSLPVNAKLQSVVLLQADFWKRHPLPGLILHEVKNFVDSPEKLARSQALVFVRELLWKHDLDDRYQDPEPKALVAAMYFPFLAISVERTARIAKLEDQDRRDWVAICLYLVRNVPRRSLLREWWKNETLKTRIAFLDLLKVTVETFDGAKEPNFCREMSMTMLDLIEDFIEDFRDELRAMAAADSDLLESAFGVITALLAKQQSVSFSSSMMRFLQLFVHDFRRILFKSRSTSYCGDLAFELVRYMNMPNARTRSEASAVLYVMMRTNWEENKSFMRMRLQSTIAVSKLAGEGTLRDYSNLEKALAAVSKLAQKDFPGTLGKEVDSLVQRLYQLIRDSLKIAEFRFDPEMTADLYYQISTGYVDSPDLRITWMENLATFHMDNSSWEEAAQTKLAIAALISEYLHMASLGDGIVRKDSPDFRAVCPNIDKEPPLPTVASKAQEEEGVYQPRVFSEMGLLSQLRLSVLFLKKAELFETCIDVYNVILEAYQYHRDYIKLGAAFLDLRNISTDLVSATAKQSRLFCNFYRVVLYGKAVKEQAGKEYIYKEPMTVRLSDLSDRLRTQYQKKVTRVHVVGNTGFDPATLQDDGDSVWVQANAVTEYFDAKELAGGERVTRFEKKFGIARFVYETPFTKDGKPMTDALDAQYKRKTYVTTELQFPYVKKRLRVVHRREEELTPIDTAVDLLRDRTRTTRHEVEADPPNLKALQALLQGSILAQVNVGPLALARTFIKPSVVGKFPAASVMALREALGEFLIVNLAALRRNKALIDTDQVQFQTECELGFEGIKRELEAYLQGKDYVPNSPLNDSGTLKVPTPPAGTPTTSNRASADLSRSAPDAKRASQTPK